MHPEWHLRRMGGGNQPEGRGVRRRGGEGSEAREKAGAWEGGKLWGNGGGSRGEILFCVGGEAPSGRGGAAQYPTGGPMSYIRNRAELFMNTCGAFAGHLRGVHALSLPKGRTFRQALLFATGTGRQGQWSPFRVVCLEIHETLVSC